MRVPRLYHPDELTVGTEITLSADAFQHSVRALRMASGDAVILFNGDGFDYRAQLTEVSKRTAQAQLLEQRENPSESPVAVHLGQVISRGDRMDFALQKSVELGVTEITPLFSERCGVKLAGERLDKKIKQWQKVVVSACEQSGRSVVPRVNDACDVARFVEHSDAALRLTLDPCASIPLRQLTDNTAVEHLALIIGPEGGFTDDEVANANHFGFKPIRVGPRILRTETAALTALSVIQYELGDLA